MLELTLEEAQEITKKAIEITNTEMKRLSVPVPEVVFEAFPPELQQQAVIGTMRIVQALQLLGFNVERRQ